MSFKKILILLLIAVSVYHIYTKKWFLLSDGKIRGDIALNGLNGQVKTLDECAGENGTMIFYMSTWCPHCAEEITRIKELQNFLRIHKIQVLIGMYGPSNDVIHKWVAKQDFPWDWKTFYWEEKFEKDFYIKDHLVPYLTTRNKKGINTFSKAGAFYTDQLTEIATQMLESNQDSK